MTTGSSLTFSVAEDIAEVATFLKKKYNVKLTEEDTRALSLKFMNVDKLLLESETAMLQGDWSPMERLREKVEQEHVAPF